MTDDVLSLVMAQLSLAIPVLCFFRQRRRSEEQCQPWAGVLLISEGGRGSEGSSAVDSLAAAEAFLVTADEGSEQSICACLWPGPLC